MNAGGTVVVGNSNTINAAGNIEEAFRWTQAGGMAGLGFLPGGLNSQAEAVNADGTVVVGTGYTTPTAIAYEAFRWTQAGGMVGLGFLPRGTLSSAEAANADGTVVVGISNGTATPPPLRRSAGPRLAAWQASASCPADLTARPRP